MDQLATDGGVVGQAGVGEAEATSNTRKLTREEIQHALRKLTVVKRNGTLVPFRRDRIARAVELAFRATRSIPESQPLPLDVHTAVQEITDDVIADAISMWREGAGISVEGIQDIVEVKLMDSGHIDVGRNYIRYRDEHKALREDSPRNLKLYRRDGKTVVRFNPLKIAMAIELALRASEKLSGPTPPEMIERVNLLTNKVVNRALELSREGVTLQVELIQDESAR